MKKQTIAIVAHDVGGSGGMERHLEEVIQRLKKDYNVIVIAATLKLTDADGIKFVRIPVLSKPVPLKIIWFSLVASIRLLFLKYDILHTTGAIVWNKADFSTVHFCHAGYQKETGNYRLKGQTSILRKLNTIVAAKLSIFMERLIYRPSKTKELVAVSNRVKAEVMDSYRYDPSDIIVIPNGVDLQKFHPASEEQKIQIREKLGLSVNGNYMIFIGGDWPLKGLRFVIEAFNTVAAEHKDLQLLVIGKGDAEAYTSYVLPQFRDRIHFKGIQRNPQDWLRASNIFVAPSGYETFSLVTHEAAATGLILMATKVGGVEDLIEDGKNGFIIERNAESIGKTLKGILEEPVSYKDLPSVAIASVESLTWDNTYDKLIQLYRQKCLSTDRGYHLEHPISNHPR